MRTGIPGIFLADAGADANGDALDLLKDVDTVILRRSLLLTGDLDRVQLEHIAGKLSTNSGITISAASGSLDSPEAIRSLKESDGVILAAEIGKSKYDHVDRILDTVHSLGKDVEGTILLN